MKTSKKRGFSLIEVLIGMLILAGTSAIFFQTIYSFRRETIFYSEHFVASALLEKVMELTYQETEINPHGLQTLSLADENNTTHNYSSYITDGQSVLFGFNPIESSNMNSLHNMLDNNFNLNIETERNNGFYDINVAFNWQDGRGKSEAFSRILAFNGEKEVEASLSLEDSYVEQRLVNNLFNDTSDLSMHIGSDGARQLLMHVGHIYFAGFNLLSSDDFQQRCRVIRANSTGFSPGSDTYNEVTMEYFEIARDILNLFESFTPRVDYILNNLNFLDSLDDREKYIIQGYISRSGHYSNQLRRLMLTSLIRLSQRYEALLPTIRDSREQRSIIKRLFDAYRILYVNRNYCIDVVTDQPIYRVEQKYPLFLNQMESYFAQRDPSIVRMAIEERNNLSDMANRHFVPAYINSLFAQVALLNDMEFNN